jgi:YidC/Oxa1 family membrane protein insertase
MKLEADICVMTTPDLNNYHLKRSLVKKDIEYIYVPHDVNSSNLTFHKEALDHFDTIFTSGYKNKAEIAEREEKFGVKKKQLVEWGSNVIDNMIEAVNALNESRAGETEGALERKKTVLIAPSWQKDNIMDSCVEEMLDSLKDSGHKIIVRPHPQYVKHFEAKVDHLAQKYADFDVTVQKDFTSNKTVYSADVLVTDWSSIAFEYAFSTLRPVLFVNTPMKVVNEDYQELSEVPIDLELRDVVGISIDEKDAPNALAAVHTLLSDEKFSADSLAQLREKYIYNVGKSGEVGAKYIIKRLIEIEKRR